MIAGCIDGTVAGIIIVTFVIGFCAGMAGFCLLERSLDAACARKDHR